VTREAKPDKRVLAAIAVVHAAAAVLTWRDLRTRTARQVRGDKRIWRIASVVNTLGSVAYWLFGRRWNTAALTQAQGTPGGQDEP
jgi:hypothetical protein